MKMILKKYNNKGLAMKTYLIAYTAMIISVTSTPATAQILGGGNGIGGAGGSMGQVGTNAAGSINGRDKLDVDPKADTRSGRASVTSNATSTTTTDASSETNITGNSVNAAASGSTSTRTSSSAGVQAIGSDGIRSMATSVNNKANATVQSVQDQAESIAYGVSRSAAGTTNTTASVATQGNAVAYGKAGHLALAGSSAASASGMFAVSPGMTIHDQSGAVVGQVKSVKTTSAGVVKSVIVENDKKLARLPARNFSASGDVLVSAMTQSQIQKKAK